MTVVSSNTWLTLMPTTVSPYDANKKKCRLFYQTTIPTEAGQTLPNTYVYSRPRHGFYPPVAVPSRGQFIGNLVVGRHVVHDRISSESIISLAERIRPGSTTGGSVTDPEVMEQMQHHFSPDIASILNAGPLPNNDNDAE